VTASSPYLAVVPAYNEQDSVHLVVAALHREAPLWDVLVIDDGSTDATSARARSAGARVMRLPFNLGIGGTVQAGFVFAHEHGYEYMAQVDGDGQHDPAELATLITTQERTGADMVCGSRFLGPGMEYPAPISRRTGIHLFAFLLSRFVGQRVSDPTSGFRLYNRRAIALFARDYPHDYPEVEAVLMVHAHRLVADEIPVDMRPRRSGRSSINSTQSAYYMLKVVLAVFVGMLRAKPTVDAGDDAPVVAELTI
jgi:glycosyltransferase involved in cell wall biosynthesis